MAGRWLVEAGARRHVGLLREGVGVRKLAKPPGACLGPALATAQLCVHLLSAHVWVGEGEAGTQHWQECHSGSFFLLRVCVCLTNMFWEEKHPHPGYISLAWHLGPSCTNRTGTESG